MRIYICVLSGMKRNEKKKKISHNSRKSQPIQHNNIRYTLARDVL